LDVNLRKCSYDKFRFSDIEEYVSAVTGEREYQYDAIKTTMIYLGGGYKMLPLWPRKTLPAKSTSGSGSAPKK
jgi:hypothetical protein